MPDPQVCVPLPSCSPNPGGLLPDSAPILVSPAEFACTENHAALSQANLLPSAAGPLGAIYFNIWTSWPWFACPSLPAVFSPWIFHSQVPIHSLEPSSHTAACLGVPSFPRKRCRGDPGLCGPSSSPSVSRLGEEEGLKVWWLLPTQQTVTAWRASQFQSVRKTTVC